MYSTEELVPLWIPVMIMWSGRVAWNLLPETSWVISCWMMSFLAWMIQLVMQCKRLGAMSIQTRSSLHWIWPVPPWRHVLWEIFWHSSYPMVQHLRGGQAGFLPWLWMSFSKLENNCQHCFKGTVGQTCSRFRCFHSTWIAKIMLATFHAVVESWVCFLLVGSWPNAHQVSSQLLQKCKRRNTRRKKRWILQGKMYLTASMSWLLWKMLGQLYHWVLLRAWCW